VLRSNVPGQLFGRILHLNEYALEWAWLSCVALTANARLEIYQWIFEEITFIRRLCDIYLNEYIVSD